MKATLHLEKYDTQIDMWGAIDLSTRVEFYGPQPNAFGIPRARSAPFRAGGFVGDTREGGSVNCETFEMCPHGNGTHTECVGHIVDERLSVADCLTQPFWMAAVVTVFPEPLGSSEETYLAQSHPEDVVVTARALRAAWGQSVPDAWPPEALVLRTLPNPESKRHQHFSGHNPVYFTKEAMEFLVEKDLLHLLVDFPSVDREEDTGLLPNHHVWWAVPPSARAGAGRPECTITEMIYVPAEVEDGPAMLAIECPNLMLDAAPSRPRLYRLDGV